MSERKSGSESVRVPQLTCHNHNHNINNLDNNTTNTAETARTVLLLYCASSLSSVSGIIIIKSGSESISFPHLTCV